MPHATSHGRRSRHARRVEDVLDCTVQRRIDDLVIRARCARIRALAALWRGAWDLAAAFEEQAAEFEHAAALGAGSDEFVEPAAPRPTMDEEASSLGPKPEHSDAAERGDRSAGDATGHARTEPSRSG